MSGVVGEVGNAFAQVYRSILALLGGVFEFLVTLSNRSGTLAVNLKIRNVVKGLGDSFRIRVMEVKLRIVVVSGVVWECGEVGAINLGLKYLKKTPKQMRVVTAHPQPRPNPANRNTTIEQVPLGGTHECILNHG